MIYTQKTNGFTLIELMVTLAVAAIIMSMAVPGFTNVIKNNRLTSTHNQILSSLMVARGEAIKRSTNITICGSNDSATCNSSNWEDGWIAFSDYNNDQIVDVGTNACLPGEDCILVVSNEIPRGLTLRNTIFANAGWVQYNSSGLINSGGTFKVCDDRGARRALALNLNTVGRASQATDTNADNIVNDADGANVTCP